MTGQAQSEGLSPVLIIVLAAVLFFAFAQKKPADGIKPIPDDPPSAVSLEMRSAFGDSPVGTATAYAAFYDACAACLETDSAPIARLRKRMEVAKGLLKLSAPVSFAEIVGRELKPFEDGAIDRQKYADAFRALSVNCKRAER
jgi:hypothetical protein